MAAPVELGLLSFLLLLMVVKSLAEKLTPEECKKLGFSQALVCSACKDLTEFNLAPLMESCENCCEKDEEEGDNRLLYQFAELQVQAFVKGDVPDRFPGLSVKYVRGADPVIKLLNDRKEVVETLSIEKWNTDSVEEFFNERLRK